MTLKYTIVITAQLPSFSLYFQSDFFKVQMPNFHNQLNSILDCLANHLIIVLDRNSLLT